MSDAGETVRQFVASFEKRDADLLGTFFDDAIVFSNHGDPEVRGKENVVQVWKRVFETFAQVRFETIHQAVNGAIVLAEQIHHLAPPVVNPPPSPTWRPMRSAMAGSCSGMITATASPPARP